ncbi:MAG: hypothetical protein QQM50_07600 [Dehalococcoides mccartyi]|uniref:hypothetical protein n=1 Tax=Dehalococcoides TaxID=61434 RepID=UPI002737BFA9|nr:hypothetical protein [Dehalococcoides mccartyi]MDP4280388.1 hypothetical protein [Dehalococcoides mccartyi]
MNKSTSVYFCKLAYIPQMTLFQPYPVENFEDAIRDIISPDKSINRYGRTWRFSLPRNFDGFLAGKLGFVSVGIEKKTNYDEQAMDFTEEIVDARQSNYVYWILDLHTHILTFETKTPDIRYQSFRGAFEGFLDYTNGMEIEDLVESTQFNDWSKSVDSILTFTANLRAPNPDYSKHPKLVGQILENTNADKAKIVLKKAKGYGSLKIESTIQDLVKYGESGYSTISACGEKDGRTKIFDSKKRIPVEKIGEPLPKDDNSIWKILISAYNKFINRSCS